MIRDLRSSVSRSVADTARRIAATPAARKPAAAALLAVLAAGLAIPLTGRTAQAKEYSTAPVVRGAVEVRVEAKGVVQPENTVRVIAPGTGTISSVAVASGSRVKRGQLLARITPSAVVVSAESAAPASQGAGPAKAPAGSDDRTASGEIASAKAQLEAARARRDEAKRQADKLAAIPDLVPRLQIEAAKRDADTAEAAFQVAAARVRTAEAAPATAKALRPAPTGPGAAKRQVPQARGELVVTAPIDGIVVSRNAEMGQTIKGAPTLFTIGDDDSAIEIRVSIPGDEAHGLVDGMPAIASTAYAPDRTFEGQLTGVDGHTDGGAVAAVMKIADADASALRPGTKVDVNVTVDGRNDVLVAPAAALRFTPEPGAGADGSRGGTTVWVRAADGALVARQIDVGLNDGRSVEIVAGLREGDLVVTGETGAAIDPTTAAPSATAIVEVADAASTAAPDFAFARTPEVETLLRYYASERGRETAEPALARSSALRGRAEEIFREEGVPTNLVWLAQVESGWQNSAVSPVGAAGIWQFMPYTAERFGLRVDDQVDERYDFEKATRAAATYLRTLNARYDGNWELAIGAYNCGEGAMDSAIARAGGVANFWTLARAGVLPDETARYVPAVLAASIVGAEIG